MSTHLCSLRCRMISAFGSGAAFSLVSGMATGNKLQGAFTTGTLFAVFQGVFFVVSTIQAACHLNLQKLQLRNFPLYFTTPVS